MPREATHAVVAARKRGRGGAGRPAQAVGRRGAGRPSWRGGTRRTGAGGEAPLRKQRPVLLLGQAVAGVADPEVEYPAGGQVVRGYDHGRPAGGAVDGAGERVDEHERGAGLVRRHRVRHARLHFQQDADAPQLLRESRLEAHGAPRLRDHRLADVHRVPHGQLEQRVHVGRVRGRGVLHQPDKHLRGARERRHGVAVLGGEARGAAERAEAADDGGGGAAHLVADGGGEHLLGGGDPRRLRLGGVLPDAADDDAAEVPGRELVKPEEGERRAGEKQHGRRGRVARRGREVLPPERLGGGHREPVRHLADPQHPLVLERRRQRRRRLAVARGGPRPAARAEVPPAQIHNRAALQQQRELVRCASGQAEVGQLDVVVCAGARDDDERLGERREAPVEDSVPGDGGGEEGGDGARGVRAVERIEEGAGGGRAVGVWG